MANAIAILNSCFTTKLGKSNIYLGSDEHTRKAFHEFLTIVQNYKKYKLYE